MRVALTHQPSSRFDQCQLTYVDPAPIAVDRARAQHAAYCDLLRRHGLEVRMLDANDAFPDSVFVEDTAIVLDELALLTALGTPTRRGEQIAVAAALADYRPVTPIPFPATIEGGDVLRVGRTLFVGHSSRTNAAGIQALTDFAGPLGYRVVPVAVTGCLHLKTGVTALDDETVLLNPAWIDSTPFARFRQMPVPEREPFAANVLRLDHALVAHAGFVATIDLLERAGYTIDTLDISEFLKAEAGLTCMSLLITGETDADR